MVKRAQHSGDLGSWLACMVVVVIDIRRVAIKVCW